MKECSNLDIIKLIEKIKQLELDKSEYEKFILNVFDKLDAYYHIRYANPNPDLHSYSCDRKDAFLAKSMAEKFKHLYDIIQEGNTEKMIIKLTYQKKDLELQKKEISDREQELLDAWNNFQNWKSKTCGNLIKDLNSKFNHDDKDL